MSLELAAFICRHYHLLIVNPQPPNPQPAGPREPLPPWSLTPLQARMRERLLVAIENAQGFGLQ